MEEKDSSALLVKKSLNPTFKKGKKSKRYGLYMKNVLFRTIELKFKNVGMNIRENLQKIIANDIEGKCVLEGYIKNNSVRVINYSAGHLISSNVKFNVSFECLICNPVENMHIKVKALNITKAGIRAEADIKGISPVDIFIARDHNFKNKQFSHIKEDDIFRVKIIGQRYEINDPTISVLAELLT